MPFECVSAQRFVLKISFPFFIVCVCVLIALRFLPLPVGSENSAPVRRLPNIFSNIFISLLLSVCFHVGFFFCFLVLFCHLFSSLIWCWHILSTHTHALAYTNDSCEISIYYIHIFCEYFFFCFNCTKIVTNFWQKTRFKSYVFELYSEKFNGDLDTIRLVY